MSTRAAVQQVDPSASLVTTVKEIQATVREYHISTCTLADVLDALGQDNCVLDARLRRVAGGDGPLVGTALPISWVPVRKGARITDGSPSTWSQVRDFVVPEVTSGRGRVYVAGAGQLVTDAALAGGLSVTYLLEQLGFEGIVLGGAVRDRAAIDASRLPVIASNFVPTDTQGAFRVASVDAECIINNVVITSGDWIFSDGNGTVIVRERLLRDVLRRAIEVERAESMILQRIRGGERLPQIIDEVGRI